MRRKKSITWPRMLILGSALSLFLAASVYEPAASTADHDRDDDGHSRISYELAWAEGADRPITSDLGYTVTIVDGALSNASISLIACSDTAATADFWSWLAPDTAYAGHGDPGDVSRWVGPQTESLPGTTSLSIAAMTVDNIHYCAAHYLVAPADDADAVTLRIEGTYTSAATAAPVPFTIQTDLAWGQVIPLPQRLDLRNAAVVVLLERDSAALFDGVDFVAMADDEIARAILRNLTSHVEIDLLPAG